MAKYFQKNIPLSSNNVQLISTCTVKIDYDPACPYDYSDVPFQTAMDWQMHLFSKTSIAIGCVIVFATSALPSPAQQSESTSGQQSTSELIANLSSPKFALRKQATETLCQSKLDIASQLVELITDGTPEQKWRATTVLMQIGLNGDEKAMAKVTRILLVLGQNGHPHLLSSASESCAAWKQHQVKKTLAQIKKLGGTVANSRAITEFGPGIVLMEVDGRLVDQVQPSKPKQKFIAAAAAQKKKTKPEIDEEISTILAAEPADDLKALRELNLVAKASPESNDPQRTSVRTFNSAAMNGMHVGHQVMFGKNWKGTDEDFELLLDLPRVGVVNIEEIEITEKMFTVLDRLAASQYQITRCEFDSKLIRKFAENHPNAYINVRGKAFLGVRGPIATVRSNTSGCNDADCEISEVLTNTAADKAGLRVGDKVTKVDEHEITSFQDLVFEIAGRKIGDTVKLTVDRDGRNGVARFEAGRFGRSQSRYRQLKPRTY